VITLNKNSKLFAITSSLIALIVYRSGGAFSDVDNYIEMYNSVIGGSTVNTELSFVLFSKMSGFMGFSYLGVFFIYALISIYSKYYFLSRFVFRPSLAVLLYGVSYFILYEFVQMRVGAAFGVFLVSLVFYDRNDHFKFIVTCVLASLLHYSIIPLALLLLLSPVFFKFKYEKFLGMSLAGIVFLLVTVFMIMFFFLMSFFPVLDFRFVFIESLYNLFSWVLPSRIYTGYVGSAFTPAASFSMKLVLSVVLSIISIVALLCGLLKKSWIYYFSGLMVIFSFWIYFFIGHMGVFAERLAEIFLLFIIVVLDGVIEKNRVLGLSLFYIVLSAFLVNLVTRASYFEF